MTSLRYAPMLLSLVLGGGSASIGFVPIVNGTDVLGIAAHPVRMFITPEFLLTVTALAGALIYRRRNLCPRTLAVPVAGAALMIVAALGSLFATSDIRYSATVLVLGLACPFAFGAALWASALPREPAAGAFLAATLFFLVRADGVFFRIYGAPTPHLLYDAKFSNTPYDFHYYTLQNPDHTSVFLVIPLALSALWALAPDLSKMVRRLLAAYSIVVLANLILVYVRFGIALGLVVALAALAASKLPIRVRWAIVTSVVVAAAAAFLFTSAGSYLREAASTESSASGSERARSIVSGFHTMLAHPLAGVGLGQYGASPLQPPAHSAIFQAGAEIGTLGFIGSTILFGFLAWFGIRAAFRRQRSLPAAAAVACSVYAVDAALTGGADLGLFNGYVAVWGMSLGLCAAIGLQEAAADVPTWSVSMRLSRNVAILVVLAAIGGVSASVAAVRTAHSPTHAVLPSPPAGQPMPLTLDTARTVDRWSFAHGVPGSWELAGGAAARPALGNTTIETGTSPTGYALESPSILLDAGEWGVFVDGHVNAGAIVVGALDVMSNRWVATVRYRQSTLHRAGSGFGVVFALQRPEYAQIILANATVAAQRSLVGIRSVSIRQVGAAPSGPPAVELGQLVAVPVSAWGPIVSRVVVVSARVYTPTAIVTAEIDVRRGSVRLVTQPLPGTRTVRVVRPLDTLTGLTFVSYSVSIRPGSRLRVLVESSPGATFRIRALDIRPAPS